MGYKLYKPDPGGTRCKREQDSWLEGIMDLMLEGEKKSFTGIFLIRKWQWILNHAVPEALKYEFAREEINADRSNVKNELISKW